MLAPTSRYHAVGTAVLRQGEEQGGDVVYLRRRFLPQPEALTLLQEHVVGPDERLDHVAWRHLGDPEQFWRIADANRAMDPFELTESVGRRLRITLPEGVPGAGMTGA